MVSDGTIVVNRLIVILLFPNGLHVHDDDLKLVIVPDQIKDNLKSLLNFSITCINSDCNNNNSVDDESKKSVL